LALNVIHSAAKVWSLSDRFCCKTLVETVFEP
jgi:hypothetical protein